MPVCQARRDYLRAEAISDTHIDAVCDTEPDGMVFNFVGPTGRVAKQKHLDNPPDSARRGCRCAVGNAGAAPGHDALVSNDKIPLLLVEGSKGILAASPSPPDTNHQTTTGGQGATPGRLKESAPSYPVTPGRNDADKMIRLVGDSLTTAGVIKDDAQIVRIVAVKQWEPGTGNGHTTVVVSGEG